MQRSMRARGFHNTLCTLQDEQALQTMDGSPLPEGDDVMAGHQAGAGHSLLMATRSSAWLMP